MTMAGRIVGYFVKQSVSERREEDSDDDEEEASDIMEAADVESAANGATHVESGPLKKSTETLMLLREGPNGWINTGGTRMVDGNFALSAPWWQVTVDTQPVKRYLRVKGHPQYNLRTDDGVDHSLISLYLGEVLRGTEHRQLHQEFFTILRKNPRWQREMTFTNLESIIGQMRGAQPESKETLDTIGALLGAPGLARLVDAAGKFPHLMKHVSQLIPRYFTKMMMTVPHKQLQALQQALDDEPWVFGFKDILSARFNLAGFEAQLNAIKVSEVWDRIPDEKREALEIYNELKAYTRYGHTYMLHYRLDGKRGAPNNKHYTDALEYLEKEKVIMRENDPVKPANQRERRVFLHRLWQAEMDIATNLSDLVRVQNENGKRSSELKSKVSKRCETMDDDQKKAVEQIIDGGVTVLSGKGGCGKTHVVSAIYSDPVKQDSPLTVKPCAHGDLCGRNQDDAETSQMAAPDEQQMQAPSVTHTGNNLCNGDLSINESGCTSPVLFSDTSHNSQSANSTLCSANSSPFCLPSGTPPTSPKQVTPKQSPYSPSESPSPSGKLKRHLEMMSIESPSNKSHRNEPPHSGEGENIVRRNLVPCFGEGTSQSSDLPATDLSSLPGMKKLPINSQSTPSSSDKHKNKQKVTASGKPVKTSYTFAELEEMTLCELDEVLDAKEAEKLSVPGESPILLTAPTGKAANLLSRRSGIPAFTMHQVIYSYYYWRRRAWEEKQEKEENRQRFGRSWDEKKEGDEDEREGCGGRGCSPHSTREKGAGDEWDKEGQFDSQRVEEPETKWKFSIVTVWVVDECSLAAVTTFGYVLKLLRENSSLQKVVLLGDVHQLPSIDPGNFLADVYNALLPFGCSVMLRTNHRSESQLIVDNATKISEQSMPRFNPSQRFVCVKVCGQNGETDGRYGIPGECHVSLNAAVQHLLRSDPVLLDHKKTQFVAFRRKDCEAINELCCKYYSDHSLKEVVKGRERVVFRKGDKVCCTKNGNVDGIDEIEEERLQTVASIRAEIKRKRKQYGLDEEKKEGQKEDEEKKENGEDGKKKKDGAKTLRLCNGEIFYVLEEKAQEDGRGKIVEHMVLEDPDKDGRRVLRVSTKQLKSKCKLSHAWARTIHTFQGSEVETVIYVVGEDCKMQNWQHVYTAITRGRQRVYILTNIAELERTVHQKPYPRFTSLEEKLTEEMKKFATINPDLASPPCPSTGGAMSNPKPTFIPSGSCYGEDIEDFDNIPGMQAPFNSYKSEADWGDDDNEAEDAMIRETQNVEDSFCLLY